MTKSTKDTIIQIAGKLFAEKGYEGTSVRDISKEADVNLASINYHFKNKEGLYHEVMNFNMEAVDKQIEEIAEGAESLQDFSWKLFAFFTESSDLFINSFKLFITNNISCEQEEIPEVCKKNNFGPPGFNAMMTLLNKQVGEEIPKERRQWAMRMIFNNIVHSSLIMSSSLVKMLEDQVEYLKEEQKKQSIILHTEAILNFLVEHPEKFDNNV